MVSVVVPNFNHSRFLKQRIDSVLSQTYQDIEVIILDDLSTDNSKEVIEHYRVHPKVTAIIYNDINSGSVFKQWIKGYSFAKGDYLWIAESDDFAKPQMLEKLIPILDNDKSIGLVYCNSTVVYDEIIDKRPYKTLNDLRFKMFRTSIWEHSFVMDGQQFLREYLSKKCVINNASAVVIRRSEFRPSEINLEQFKYAGDWAVYLHIALTNKIAFCHESWSYYRIHCSNTSKRAFINNRINLENYIIISNYFNGIKNEWKVGLKYVYFVRRAILTVLVTKKERMNIIIQYNLINSNLLYWSLIFLPQVIIETSIGRIYKKVFRIN